MKKSLYLLPALIFSLGVLPLSAQEVRVNEKGEKIIVYPDGTWQYFTIFGGSKDVLFDKQDAKVNDPEPDFGVQYPVFQGEIAPLDLAFSIPEEYARRIAIRKAQLAAEAKMVADKRAVEAQAQRQKLEEEMKSLQADEKTDSDALRRLVFRLNAARKTENESQMELMQADKAVASAEVLTQKGVYLKQLRAATRKESKLQRSASATTVLQSSDFIAGLAFADNAFMLPEETLENLRAAPTPGCRLAYEGMDKDMNQFRRDVQKQTLFTHTDERLRLFLKDKEYLRCEGYTTSIGGYRFITLQFTFAYPNAREAYGFIEKGSILTVKLLDGSFVNLRSGKMDKGSYDTITNLLTYSVHYPIDRTQMSLLRNSEVDSVLVFWSSGYEEYEVFEVDFFINQLACLEK
ncbi:MAG: hypothetical protein KF852_04920 [Saprospiraceae bacterium]|nr:hypothetical protein [Saprospiraceae bacterium]